MFEPVMFETRFFDNAMRGTVRHRHVRHCQVRIGIV